MVLVFPTIEHKQAALEYRQEHLENNEKHIHGSSGFVHTEDYKSWLERIMIAQTKVPPNFVTGSVYFAIVEDRIIGTIAIRDYLNDSLLKTGGHIGYGVRPSERRKGYGSKMLTLALDKCRKKGIEKVLATCDKDNIASAKTVLKNGGIFENEFTEESGNIVQRYWISL